MRYDLAWGNSVAVRQAFVANANAPFSSFNSEDLLKFDYPEHEGDPALIELTRKVIERQTGLNYRHILLTNGATGGVVISLRAYAQQGFHFCCTRKAPFYVRYPRMINASGLEHIQEDDHVFGQIVVLTDLPSNPLGLMEEVYPRNSHISNGNAPVILDGVYLNRVYMNTIPAALPVHQVAVGSYSKLLGINGIRVGWIATNDDLLYERLKELVASEYCGLATASTKIIMNCLDGFNWHNFETEAKALLDNNREEWSKVERYFGGQPTSPVGMFYYGPVDYHCKKLLANARVHYTNGAQLGTDDNFGRFNLGQDNRLTLLAVKAILKADGRK